MRFAFFGVASGFDESRLGVAFGQAIDQPLFFAARPKIKDFVSLDELCSLISLSIEILQDSDRIIYTHMLIVLLMKDLQSLMPKHVFRPF